MTAYACPICETLNDADVERCHPPLPPVFTYWCKMCCHRDLDTVLGRMGERLGPVHVPEPAEVD